MHTLAKALLLLALLAAACAGSEAAMQPDEQKPTVVARGPVDFGSELGFRLAIPSGYQVSAFEGPDFVVYSIAKDEQLVLAFYAGNFADFPSPNARGTMALTMVGQLEGACFGWSTRASRRSRECLVALDRDFPAQLHLWYVNLADAERARAESILATLAATGP